MNSDHIDDVEEAEADGGDQEPEEFINENDAELVAEVAGDGRAAEGIFFDYCGCSEEISPQI